MYKPLLSSLAIACFCGSSALAQDAMATSAMPKAGTSPAALDEAARIQAIQADKPVTSPDAGLMAAISVSAHDSIEKIQIDSTNLKIRLLINLAEAEITVGDTKRARDALVEARSTPQFPASLTADFVVQSFRAGDTQGAMELIQKTPANVQFRAFGKLATTQIEDGDVAGVEKSIGLIDALYDKTAREPRDPSRQRNVQDSYDHVLSDIAKTFAMKGDISHAQALATKISDKGSLSDALADIAKAQHKAGDQHAAQETLRQFKRDVEESYGNDPQQFAIVEALAFDYAGDDSDARNSLLAAHEALKKQVSLAPIDRLQRVSQIVDGLIAAGAFSDAIAISAELDDLNRPQHIASAIREEIKRGDTQAVRETAAVALKLAETATPFSERDLTAVAIALGRAGLTDDAK